MEALRSHGILSPLPRPLPSCSQYTFVTPLCMYGIAAQHLDGGHCAISGLLQPESLTLQRMPKGCKWIFRNLRLSFHALE